MPHIAGQPPSHPSTRSLGRCTHYALDLAVTSAKNLLAFEEALRAQGLKLKLWVPEIPGRGFRKFWAAPRW